MARKHTFLEAEWSDRWKESYAELPDTKQEAVDEAAIALIKQKPTPGMRVKPIHPDKYYSEARINSGDRIIFRVNAGRIYFVDIVPHDLIARFGRRPRAAP